MLFAVAGGSVSMKALSSLLRLVRVNNYVPLLLTPMDAIHHMTLNILKKQIGVFFRSSVR